MWFTDTLAGLVQRCVHWPVCLWERETGKKSPLCACVFVGGKQGREWDQDSL